MRDAKTIQAEISAYERETEAKLKALYKELRTARKNERTDNVLQTLDALKPCINRDSWEIKENMWGQKRHVATLTKELWQQKSEKLRELQNSAYYTSLDISASITPSANGFQGKLSLRSQGLGTFLQKTFSTPDLDQAADIINAEFHAATDKWLARKYKEMHTP